MSAAAVQEAAADRGEDRRWRGEWLRAKPSVHPSLDPRHSLLRIRLYTLPSPDLGPSPSVAAGKLRRAVAAGKVKEAADNVAAPKPDEGVASSGRDRRTCYLTRLPDELLLAIFHHLVPTGITLHLLPVLRGQQMLGTVFHALGKSRSAEWPPTANHSAALATVSRRFSTLYLGLLYGENSWLVECCDGSALTTVLEADVNCPPPPSWCRLMERRPSDRWPLAAGAAATCIRDLTVLVRLEKIADEGQRRAHVMNLRQQLGETIAALGPTPRLQRLRVHVGYAHAPRIVIEAVGFSRPRSDLRCVRRSDRTHEIELESGGPASPADLDAAGPTWGVLDGLRGVEDVRLSGLITEPAAAALGGGIRRDVDHSVEDGGEGERRRGS
ncbi:hypothetical protein LTR53_008179 [Teratosphaeriaceae sp. CCFEE 6253]|nr:hypothetical protein LTR53_008179 [Teratosphaeriaceae sp. CCFEE 6253]